MASEAGAAMSAGQGGGSAGRAVEAAGSGMPATNIVGTWSGTLRDLVVGRDFKSCIKIMQVSMPGASATGSYVSSMTCETHFDFVSQMGSVYEFRETPVSGRGCPDGKTLLKVVSADSLKYEWYLSNQSSPETTGTLARAQACP